MNWWELHAEHGFFKPARHPRNTEDVLGSLEGGVWYRNSMDRKHSHLHRADGEAWCGKTIIPDPDFYGSDYERVAGFWLTRENRKETSTNCCGECKRKWTAEFEYRKAKAEKASLPTDSPVTREEWEQLAPLIRLKRRLLTFHAAWVGLLLGGELVEQR